METLQAKVKIRHDVVNYIKDQSHYITLLEVKYHDAEYCYIEIEIKTMFINLLLIDMIFCGQIDGIRHITNQLKPKQNAAIN